jgi:hypothetical protein
MSTNTNKLQTAQDIFEWPYDTSFGGGFNQRVFGDSYQDAIDAWDRGARGNGWLKAEEMIQDGRIYFVHPFPHNCRGDAFPYGGTWVCNACGQSRLEKPWWRIRVFKDGAAWCCVGEGFYDLQASDNYAFGDTRDEAITAYGQLMQKAAQ